jgi:pilus assembly protein Flp/PilA
MSSPVVSDIIRETKPPPPRQTRAAGGTGNRQEFSFMTNSFIRFAGDEWGVTAIEYGLIAALVSLGIISAVTTIGTTISANFFGPIGSAL